MKKEIIISDIDFSNPINDQKYVKNIVRNLVGNYYFSAEINFPTKQELLYTKSNYKNLSSSIKPSLASDESDLSVSAVQSSMGKIKMPEEYVTLTFNMKEWQNASEEDKINLEQQINNKLADSYYFGLSKIKDDTIAANAPDEDKLIKKYGEYFYDHSIIMQTPFIFPNTDKELEDKVLSNASSGTYSSVAKIESLYNFYDKEFEDTANKNAEPLLFNFYTLFYDNPQASLEELLTGQLGKIPKEKIIFSPDSVDLLTEYNNLKYEQPFGMEITFPPQDKKSINSLIGNLSSMFAIEKYVYKENKEVLNNKEFIAEASFLNDGTINFKKFDKIEYVSLNDWAKTLVTNEPTIDSKSIVFSKTKNSKESQFLSKIKKFLLQKKITSLINTEKRTFTDMISGIPAYSEVLFYEIKKYKNDQQIQSILIPNTKDIDFLKYFDTQIKYNTNYTYEILAWTFIIGNKYKYFDRVELPPSEVIINKITHTPYNNATDESGFFKWFRISDVFSKLYIVEKDFLKVEGQNYFTDIVKKYPSLFGYPEEANFNVYKNVPVTPKYDQFGKQINVQLGVEATNLKKEIFLNFSKTLDVSYMKSEFNIFNYDYKNLLDNNDTKKTKNNIQKYLDEVAENFSTFFAKILTKSKNNKDLKKEFIVYKKTKGSNTNSIIDKDFKNILNSSKIIQEDTVNVVENDDEFKLIINILKLFQNAGILKSTLFLTSFENPIFFPSETNIKSLIKSNFIKDFNLFLKGGFSESAKEIQKIDLTKTPNVGLDPFSETYYPRFKISTDNKQVSAKLQFGVYNEPDIILAGIPYIAKPDVLPIKVFSSPPTAPDVLIIPYKNVSNKVKFFLNDTFDSYRIKPIAIEANNDTAFIFEILKTYEKQKGFFDGKITYRSDEPAKEFWVYRSETKPVQYNDFFNKKIATVKAEAGGFEDNIEPNKKYYYTFVSADVHGLFSNPTEVFELEMIENSGAIYPITKVINLEEEDYRKKVFSFKEQFNISVNSKHILENEKNSNTKNAIKSAAEIADLSKFGSLSPSIFQKKFKIRITSKTTKKKLDINLIFNKQFDIADITAFISEQAQKTQAAQKQTQSSQQKIKEVQQKQKKVKA